MKSAPLKCLLESSYDTKEELEAAEKAVSHEGHTGGRAEAEVSKKGNVLLIEIQAKDVVALRATANAYLRALQVFESLEEVQK
ncbi:hypothetical protein GF318_01360 [Candidatus Micrarchaeota archaeon]|nr:hypothetical protein [Candidatus Micrarchaeota archaeon]